MIIVVIIISIEEREKCVITVMTHFCKLPSKAAALLLGVFLQVPFNAHTCFPFCYEHMTSRAHSKYAEIILLYFSPFKSNSLSSCSRFEFYCAKMEFLFQFQRVRERETDRNGYKVLQGNLSHSRKKLCNE